MRLIDADKIEFHGLNNRICPDLSAMDVIDEQPTVSAIPAPVKCGECKHWERQHIGILPMCDKYLHMHPISTDFCKHGERKDGTK